MVGVTTNNQHESHEPKFLPCSNDGIEAANDNAFAFAFKHRCMGMVGQLKCGLILHFIT